MALCLPLPETRALCHGQGPSQRPASQPPTPGPYPGGADLVGGQHRAHCLPAGLAVRAVLQHMAIKEDPAGCFQCKTGSVSGEGQTKSP